MSISGSVSLSGGGKSIRDDGFYYFGPLLALRSTLLELWEK